jgi:hypothetical protein
MASNFVWAALGGQALVVNLWARRRQLRQHCRPAVVRATVQKYVDDRHELKLAS